MWVIRKIANIIDTEDLAGLAEAVGGFYIKVVVDIKTEVMVGGAKMHVDEEQMLLDEGSNKGDLWGGGYDLETKQVTFDSIINNKPGVNLSSEILNQETRKKFEIIIRGLLGV